MLNLAKVIYSTIERVLEIQEMKNEVKAAYAKELAINSLSQWLESTIRHSIRG